MPERWLKDALKWMVKSKWITVNSKKEGFRVISYNQLCNKLNLQSNSAVVYETDEFSGFKDFCRAVVITYYLKIKILTGKKDQSVSNLVNTSTSWYFYSKGLHSLPISYLAKCLGVSDSTANNYKQYAIETSLIEVKKNLGFITDREENKLGIEHLHSYKAIFPELAGRIRTNGTYLRLVSADIFKSIAYTKRDKY